MNFPVGCFENSPRRILLETGRGQVFSKSTGLTHHSTPVWICKHQIRCKNWTASSKQQKRLCNRGPNVKSQNYIPFWENRDIIQLQTIGVVFRVSFAEGYCPIHHLRNMILLSSTSIWSIFFFFSFFSFFPIFYFHLLYLKKKFKWITIIFLFFDNNYSEAVSQTDELSTLLRCVLEKLDSGVFCLYFQLKINQLFSQKTINIWGIGIDGFYLDSNWILVKNSIWNPNRSDLMTKRWQSIRMRWTSIYPAKIVVVVVPIGGHAQPFIVRIIELKIEKRPAIHKNFINFMFVPDA